MFLFLRRIQTKTGQTLRAVSLTEYTNYFTGSVLNFTGSGSVVVKKLDSNLFVPFELFASCVRDNQTEFNLVFFNGRCNRFLCGDIHLLESFLFAECVGQVR